MRGLQILIQALGIKIDPAEVEVFYERMRRELPEAIESLKALFSSMDARLAVIDQSLDEITKILGNLNQRVSVIEDSVQFPKCEQEVRHGRSNGKDLSSSSSK